MRSFGTKQKLWSSTGKFGIKDETGRLTYHVQGSFLKFLEEFTISDGQGQFVSHIKYHFSFPFQRSAATFTHGKQVTIQQRFSLLKAKCDVSDFGLEVAGDIWNMSFSLLDQRREVASIRQEWFEIASAYHVDIYDDSLADLVISLVVAIDYVKAIESSSSPASSWLWGWKIMVWK